MNRSICVIDIETYPSAAALEQPCPEEWLTRGVKENFKEDTVDRYRAANLVAWPEERTRRASLDWRSGQIAALGWVIGDAEPVVHCSSSEGFLLTKFWEMMATHEWPVQVAGFCIRDFDWPWLLGRSAARRIKPTRFLRSDRYSPSRTDVLDWADVLSSYGAFPTKGWRLSDYAATFGLPATVGDGKDVPEWMANGETDKVLDHLRGDLVTTAALDQLFRPTFIG